MCNKLEVNSQKFIMELFESNCINHDITLRLRKRQPFYQTNYANRQKLIDMFVLTMFIPLNIYFKSLGLQIHKIELKKYTTGEPATSSKEFKKVLTIQESFTAKEIPDYMCQEARDTANMSERKYNKFRKVVNQLGGRLASMYSSNLIKTQMSKFYTILPNALGFYVKPKEKVNFVLTKIFEKLGRMIANDTFDLLISGDGLQLTRTHTNTVNFTFKVLNEKDPSAIYTLGKFLIVFSFSQPSSVFILPLFF